MVLPRKNFESKIHNKHIMDFTKQLNYNIQNQQERVKIVNNILYDKNGKLNIFFQEYFDKYFKYNLSKEDFLSEDINVCQALEKMANYILFAPDGKPLNKKVKYNFYKSEEEFLKKTQNIVSLEALIEEINENNENEFNTYDEIIDFLVRKQNYYKEKKQKIYKKDLYDEELKPIQEYQKTIDALYKKLQELRKYKKLNYKTIKKIKALSRWVGDCRWCQIYCKDAIKRTIYFKRLTHYTTETTYDTFDFMDKNHIMALLKCHNSNLQTDLGCLVYDLNTLINNIKLNEQERKILNMYREEDMTQEKIAEKLGLSQQFVSQTIEKIVNRIIKQYYRIYEDWYYLNICKGKYKKCSKCGEIKLISYFGKDDRNKDGLKSICRKCDNIIKKIKFYKIITRKPLVKFPICYIYILRGYF